MADPMQVQYQVRQNSEELQDFLKDLNAWERDIQTKDKSLACSGEGPVSSLPVRNKHQKSKKKEKPKTKQQKSSQTKPKLKGFDFDAWEKFDVDDALKEIEEDEEMETQSTSDDDDDDDDDDEYVEQRRLQQALFEKEKGNDLFKEGKYEAAINRYTTAIGLDPYSAILPANRAMALIKVKRYGAAIQDCDTSLSLDNTYIKAYARRASAKKELGRLTEALEDYEKILELQPENKQAIEEIEKIKKILSRKSKEAVTNIANEQVEPSKKPMKRYIIEEIGDASSDEDAEVLSEQIQHLKMNKDIEKEKLVTEIDNQTTAKTIRNADQIHLDNTDPSCSVGDHSVKSECPVKTTAENTAYLKTNEISDRPSAVQAVHGHLTNHESDKTSVVDLSISNVDLTAPTSSIQFQRTWKRLENHPELLYKYMKGIPPDYLPKVVSENVESTLLVSMLKTLCHYIRDNLPIFNEMKHLSDVKRFSMTLMFLSNEEKNVIKELFQYLDKTSTDTRTFTEDELQCLKKKYGLR